MCDVNVLRNDHSFVILFFKGNYAIFHKMKIYEFLTFEIKVNQWKKAVFYHNFYVFFGWIWNYKLYLVWVIWEWCKISFTFVMKLYKILICCRARIWFENDETNDWIWTKKINWPLSNPNKYESNLIFLFCYKCLERIAAKRSQHFS